MAGGCGKFWQDSIKISGLVPRGKVLLGNAYPKHLVTLPNVYRHCGCKTAMNSFLRAIRNLFRGHTLLGGRWGDLGLADIISGS
jgi:hypothetical protein